MPFCKALVQDKRLCSRSVAGELHCRTPPSGSNADHPGGRAGLGKGTESSNLSLTVPFSLGCGVIQPLRRKACYPFAFPAPRSFEAPAWPLASFVLATLPSGFSRNPSEITFGEPG